MLVELSPIDSIIPYDRNPRVNDAAVDAVAKSIRAFGFRQPIVVDEQNVIIVGHTRWKAAKQLGHTEVPVHVAVGLSAEQARAYRIADNQTATLSDWDNDKLVEELKSLQNADYDLDLTGFSDDQLSQYLYSDPVAGQVDPDDIPAMPDAATTQLGDIWLLGEHRVMCGDSSKPGEVDRLLDGNVIHLINSDPPYNVRVEPRSNNAIAAGLSSFPGTTHHQQFDVERHPEKAKPTSPTLRPKDRPLANDSVSDEEFQQLLQAWFGNMARVLEPGRSFYIWGGYANLGNYPPALKANGLYFSQGIVWNKLHPVLTRKDYMGCFELCQPPETQVLTAAGTSSLHALRDGDRVVSFYPSDSTLVGRRDGHAIRTTQRGYEGKLYGVTVGPKQSWSTDGHLWTVRLTSDYPQKWCVYLMRRGDWWRVGMTKMRTTWGFGLKGRLCSEHGDEGWILSLHDSHTEARLQEQWISIQYGIPQTCWTDSCDQHQRQATQVIAFYARLDLCQLAVSCATALRDFHRSLDHPFVRNTQTRSKFGARQSIQVRACNLLPEIMEIPVPSGAQRTTWERIRVIDVQSYAGPVHSLDVATHQHYIADGLVTHNCYYGWKEGKGHEFFGPNNVLDLWDVKKVSSQQSVHLTEKPVELAVRAMTYSSRAGENVLDLFGGSGSTLIAAEQLNRRAFLMELDPLYCDVIVSRYESFSGKKAQRVPTTNAIAQNDTSDQPPL
jgi:DNA modification methylase